MKKIFKRSIKKTFIGIISIMIFSGCGGGSSDSTGIVGVDQNVQNAKTNVPATLSTSTLTFPTTATYDLRDYIAPVSNTQTLYYNYYDEDDHFSMNYQKNAYYTHTTSKNYTMGIGQDFSETQSYKTVDYNVSVDRMMAPINYLLDGSVEIVRYANIGDTILSESVDVNYSDYGANGTTIGVMNCVLSAQFADINITIPGKVYRFKDVVEVTCTSNYTVSYDLRLPFSTNPKVVEIYLDIFKKYYAKNSGDVATIDEECFDSLGVLDDSSSNCLGQKVYLALSKSYNYF